MNRIPDHKQGDTWNGGVFEIKNADTTPFNLSGYTVKSDFKTSANGFAVFSFNSTDGTITIPNPANGKIYFMPKIIDVVANDYIFDLQITSAVGIVNTIASGYWRITPDITK